MTVHIERFSEDKIEISTDHDLRDRDLIKQLPGARYDLKSYKWRAPLTWATCKAMRGIFGEQLQIGEKLTIWAQEYKDRYIDPAISLRTSYNIDNDHSSFADIVRSWRSETDKPLYPFQEAGVVFLGTVERALLCDEMGTGKTRQIIETLKLADETGDNPFPGIVVAPKNMLMTWKNEFKQWWPEVKVNIITGSAANRRKMIADEADIYVINFESVRSHSRLAPYGSVRLNRCIVCDPTLPDIPFNQQSRCEICKKELNNIDWKSVIVDEAHRMKNPKAKQSRACWALRTDATKYVFALTGTAISSAPNDLWPSLHLVSKDEFPTKSKFIDRYCQSSINAFGGMQITGLKDTAKEEFFSIVDPKMRRMPKKAVLPFLPDKTYSTRYVEMSAKQAKTYKQMESGLVAAIGEEENNVVVAFNPLVQLTRLSQFASAYAELDEDGNVRMSNPSNKIDALLELIDDMYGESLVVFAHSRQLIDLTAQVLDKHKISYGMIVGGQTNDEREKAKDDFQNGRTQLILCTISAGGIGLTLTKASTAVFMQRSWSMIDNKQAEDRVHRIGSEIYDKVEIIDILSTGTLEDRQRLVLGTKEDRLEEIMRDKDTILKILGKE